MGKRMKSLAIIGVITLAVFASLIIFFKQPEGVMNVDLSYLAEHMEEFENKVVRVTGTVSYPSPIGIPEFPKFWLNGVEVRASMGKILPSENSIVTVVGTVTKVGENFYVIFAESWTEAGV